MNYIKITLLTIITLFLSAESAFADLKAVNVADGWDEKKSQFQHSNNRGTWDGRWISFLHKLDFDSDSFVVDSCGTTSYAGIMEFGQYYIDDSPLGALGFTETRNWSLVACDRNNDGLFNGGDLAITPQTYMVPYNSGTLSVISQDIETACTTGNCEKEIVTTLLVNLDDDCDNTQNTDIPAGGVCFYAEARTAETGPDTLSWGGNVQVRISVAGGEKTVNYSVTVGTPVVVSSFLVIEDSGQVFVEWETASEVNTIGFNLERQDPETGKFTQVNKELLIGLLNAPQGGIYSFVDASAQVGTTHSYKLIEIQANGKERIYGPYNNVVISHGNKLVSEKSSAKAHGLSNHKKERLKLAKESKEKAKNLKKKRKGTSLKIAVAKDGMYYISSSEIAALFGVPVKRVQNWIKNGKLFLNNKGENVATTASQKNHGLYFFGQVQENIYSDTNTYWLDLGKNDSNLEMTTVDGRVPKGASSKAANTFIHTVVAEEQHFATTALSDDPETDFWMWDYIYAPYLSTKTFSIKTPGASDTGDAILTIQLQGASNTDTIPDHHAIVFLNGTQVGEARWDGLRYHSEEFIFPQSLLNDGNNNIQVEGSVDAGAPYSFFYIDSFELAYSRQYHAQDDMLMSNSNQKQILSIDGFSSDDIMVFDISQPYTPRVMTNTTIVNLNTSGFEVKFKANSPDSRYLTLSTSAVASPKSVVTDKKSSLKKRKNSADYLVIAPSELLDAASRLANYRTGTGYNTMVVELEDIMDEFNHGNFSPHAIRDFLTFAYNNWVVAPRYVVLAGEGTYDYKDYMGYGDSILPPLLVPTFYGLFASDNIFGDVNDDGIPEIAIGRIPVLTPAELDDFTAKLKTHEANSYGDWQRNVLMLADNDDNGGDFPVDSDNLSALLEDTYDITKVYLSENSADIARQLTLEHINNGTLLVNYIGHAGLTDLADEGLLRKIDVDSLTNSNTLPVMTAMTCVVNRFGVPGFDTFGESVLLANSKGMSAVWGPTGISLNAEAVILDNAFFKSAFVDNNNIIGDVIIDSLAAYKKSPGAKRWIMNIYTLLGDPAMTIR